MAAFLFSKDWIGQCMVRLLGIALHEKCKATL